MTHATYETVTKEQLGGVDVHSVNGSVDNVATSEQDAFDQIKRWLSYLPSSNSSLPPAFPSSDPPNRRSEELLSIIPRRRNRSYDIRKVIDLVCDRDSFFEIGATWGRSVVVGFARLDGRSVGVVSSDCQITGGTLSARGAQKLRRHVDLWSVGGHGASLENKHAELPDFQ